MIRSFAHKGLADLWRNQTTSRIDRRFHGRILRRLDTIDRASKQEDLNVPGFDFHSLRGFTPVRYTIHVNGPWCITFEFDGEHADRVDFDQYH